MSLIVRSRSVAHHGHDVRERHARPVVLVGIEENTQALEAVCGPEDGALSGTLLGNPEGKAIAVQIILAVDLKF